MGLSSKRMQGALGNCLVERGSRLEENVGLGNSGARRRLVRYDVLWASKRYLGIYLAGGSFSIATTN